MGGVAGACKKLGNKVFGSEEVLYEPMRSYLANCGVEVFSSFDPEHILSLNPDRIVVGNAVSRGNEELEFALEHKLDLISLPELVAQQLIGKRTSVVIAGTHGKTTTTAMTANMLTVGGLRPGFMIGGVPGNFSVSCLPAEGDVFVIEGDEYDSAYYDKRSKFMHYRPDIAVVNNIEFDHADIFDDLEAIKKSFRLFIRLVPRNGLVLANGDDPVVAEVLKVACSPVETFGFGDSCFWRVVDLEESPEGSRFTVLRNGEKFGEFASPANGRFNALNMLIAIICGHRLGMPLNQLQSGAASYLPPKRRMQEKGTWRGALVIDDFGHHPTAIRETIDALIARYPNRRLIACFEPRTNTTTRRFYQQEIVDCFAKASGVAIGALDRPWRYSDSERLDLDWLRSQFKVPAFVLSLEQGKESDWGKYVRDWLEDVVQPGDLVVTFSNGDFGGLRAMLAQ
ncbi:MAG: UDP-N-acetylmuramate--alanine ligase [Armatimonadetes bacterium]|nr:UDP-N-acetylmuramate--alanine ligase [Armatimonadota bacterium]